MTIKELDDRATIIKKAGEEALYRHIASLEEDDRHRYVAAMKEDAQQRYMDSLSVDERQRFVGYEAYLAQRASILENARRRNTLDKLREDAFNTISTAFTHGVSNIPPWAKEQAAKKQKEESVDRDLFSGNNLSEVEAKFFRAFDEKLKAAKIAVGLLRLNRMADKTLQVTYRGAFIGSIKLAGRVTRMQCLARGVERLKNEPFETYLERQGNWVDHIAYTIYTNSVPLWEPMPLPFDEWKKQKADATPIET